MAGARHTGKLIIEIEPRSVAVHPHASVSFRSDASYVITGGLGGFGLELAAWLAEHGAGHLVLLGRRGRETPSAERAMARLAALGASVQIEACDVADAEHVRLALAAIPAQYPLRGVFHAAAVLDDALLKNLDLERYRKTFEPKVLGAWHLHEQTRALPLDYFMCFSSMASVLGNQGSANYCAANAFVDSLAHHRRQLGLPALTVNWGVIADVGMAADEDFYRQNLERNGLQTIHSRHCLELLGVLLEQKRVQTTVCPIDFEVWLQLNPAGREARLQELLAASVAHSASARTLAAEEVALRAELDALDATARRAQAQFAVRNVLAQVFRIEAQKIDAMRSLTALGADSLMAIEIKNRLQSLGLPISVTQLLNRNSVTSLAELLLAALGYAGGANDDAAAPSEPIQAPSQAAWFARPRPRPDAKLRLICFPYAGGGSAVYQRWPDTLPDWIEVVAVSLPGRGLRADDGFLPGIGAAADAMLPELLALLDRPFALFGHCMGAIMMYEVAQRLQQQHARHPVHIFASGCMAPHLYNSPLVHEQDDGMFLDVLRLISFSGTRALIEDPELRSSLFPMLRGDFRAVVEYGDSFRPAAPLAAPITGLAADNDLFAAPKAMHAWGSYTAQRYELAQLPGDHYFVESDRETVTQIVSDRLASSLQLSAAATPSLPTVRWLEPARDELAALPPATPLHRGARRPIESDAAVQVLCFPATGILAGEFRLPDSDVELRYRTLEWRGPQGSPAPRTVAEMVQHAYDAIGGELQQRTIFFGHCLGSIVAYELALRLQQEGGHLPEHLLVAGVVGPHLYVAPDAHRLPTDKLLELLSVLKYPFSERLRRDPKFRAARLDGIRADLEAMAAYEYRTRELLAAPVTAISFRHDLWSYPLRTESWQLHTQEGCQVIEWEGDHYYALQHPERVHDLARTFVSRAIAAE
jgi:surfactin synthase thioesterase subunit/NAD(P)-dependent dehydrogenase (short-subunit alcohol dehydrogenase family)/acyl carrier protein